MIADNTKPIKFLAIALIAGGAMALAYGGFDYSRGRETTKIGPIDISVRDERHVTIPVWAGVASIVIGTVLLVFPVKR